MKAKIKLTPIIIIIFLMIVTLSSCPFLCTDIDGTKECLKRNNYVPLEVGGYSWLNGDKSDLFKTKFKAIAPNKDTVTGVVTKGIFKGKTIRLD